MPHFPGGVGPLGPGPGGPPMPPPPMSSPEMDQGGAISPEVSTILSSPLADRLVGPLMQMQKMGKMAKVGDAVRGMLKMLAGQMLEMDPKKAATLEQLAAKILTLLPQPGNTPSSPAGMMGLQDKMPPA